MKSMAKTRFLIPALAALLLLAGGSAELGAQDIDIQAIDPSQVDLSKVDLTDVAFYFEGPLELYISGIRYGENTYAAILNYDGGRTIDVEVPEVVTTEGKPQTVDLTRVGMIADPRGIRLEDVMVDGILYSGWLSVTRNNRLAVESLESVRRVAALGEYREELNQEIEQLEALLKVKNERIERLNSQIEEMPEEERVRELRSQVNELEDQVEQQSSTIADLRSRLREARTEAWETAAQRLTRRLFSGFGSGSPAYGSWQASAGSVSQSDAGVRYAKFAIPVSQNAGEMLYTFSGRASGSGWRGYGLHFLASASSSSDGYGYGKSYLIWVTRDVSHYQSPQTRVQLYRSYDDVHMVELVSIAVDRAIDSSNQVQVYVDRDNQSLAIVLNGEHLFSFQDSEFIRSGNGVAVRALGTATVRDLEVRAP
jgi:hypothetical protein